MPTRPEPEQAQTRTRKFREKVYQIVSRIPKGRVMTYGGIAKVIPPPEGIPASSYRQVRARWVGYAMRACPEGLPWQRVVNSEGAISLRLGHGPDIQRVLLEQEGVVFDRDRRIDLEKFEWFPDHDWLISHSLLPPPAS